MQVHERLQKFVPLNAAMDAVVMSAEEAGLKGRSAEVVKTLLEFCVPVPGKDGPVISLMDLHGFMSNLQKAIQTQDHSFLFEKRGLKVGRVVDVQEFTESPEYMGQRGHVRPAIMSELRRLFDEPNYIEAVLTGAIGIGKNYFADMAMAYMLYLLSVYVNPQVEFDLAPGSSIVFIMQSMSLALAKKVAFGQFADRLRVSPYFHKFFPFDTNFVSELRFPNNITVYPAGGSDTAAIGMNVFGGVIDEMNFMARTRDSQFVKFTHEQEYDQAERLYTTLIRRMQSRFMQHGRLPGKLIMISSVNYPGDFTDRKMEEAREEIKKHGKTTIFVMKLSAWESLPKDRFSGETFLVEVGNELKMSRMIDSMPDAVDEEDVIEVPIEYKSVFERDLPAALRDIAGVATGSTHPFIPYRHLINQAQLNFGEVMNGRQLFKQESCILSRIVGDPYDPEWEHLIDLDYVEDFVLNREQVFAAHIDVGITQDALGIAIGRIIGDKLLPSAKYYDERSQAFIEVKDMRAPIYQIDGLLQVTPPPSGEIDLELARDLILFLRSLFNLQWVSLDSYQSVMLIQSFRKMRIRSGVLSVDVDMTPYAELKQAIKDERLLFPPHIVAARELREIEKNPTKNKIDHPQGGSKDVADAMAGCVYILNRKEGDQRRQFRRSRSDLFALAEASGSQQQGVRKIRFRNSHLRGSREL